MPLLNDGIDNAGRRRLGNRPAFRCAARWTGLALAALASLAAPPLPAQTPTPQLTPAVRPYDFYGRGPYAGELPRPEDVRGFAAGEFHTNYGAFQELLRAYAGSPRLRVFEMGRTEEHRPMHLLAISTPANLARLESIRATHQRLAAGATAIPPAELDRLARETPVTVWLSYNIHGDESAGLEAAIQVLYQLLDGRDPALERTLENVVVLMNPCQNPDGRERFVAWMNAHGTGRPETFAYEKTNPWNVQGRFNHFYFDLNRDMLVVSQAESRHALRAFLHWRPQIAADHHGETKEYFFPPAALPINANLPRAELERWLDVFGRGNAAAFDRYGWLYYVRDIFDVYYPGYWDSWPSLQGATGMTYETSAGGKLGLRHRRDDDTIVTFRDAIARHVVASLATLETAAAHREARLRSFREFFVSAIAEGQQSSVRTFVVPPPRDPGRGTAMIDLLLRHGVEVRRAEAPFRVEAAHDYFGAPAQAREFPAGSLCIDVAQPQGRVAKALLELETPQDEIFLRRQEEKRVRNETRGDHVAKEDYEFYDLTAWALPLTFGVETWFTGEALTVATVPLIAPSDPVAPFAAPPAAGLAGRTAAREPSARPARAASAGAAASGATPAHAPARGEPVARPELDAWRGAPPPAPARANTAYVWAPHTEAGVRLALRLLQDGYRVAAATRPLRAGGTDFPRGSLIARTERNPEELHARIATLAPALGVPVTAVDTAFADTGSTGVGSEAVFTLRAPKVAVIVGDGVSPTGYGALRFLLERTYDLEFVPLTVGAFRAVRMSDFNVVIVPDGRGYARAFGADGVTKLQRWMDDGGTLIALGGAAEFAADPEVKLTTAKLVGHDEKPANADDADTDEDDAATEDEVEAVAAPVVAAALEPIPTAAENDRPGAEATAPLADPPAGSTALAAGPVAPTTIATTKKPKKPKKPLPVPGAVLRARVNHDHFVTFGYEADELPIPVSGDVFFKTTKTGTNLLTFRGDALRVAGFVWPDNTEVLLRGCAAAIAEPHGAGQLVLFADDPGYRHIWHATTRLLLNAVLYGPALSAEPGAYHAHHHE